MGQRIKVVNLAKQHSLVLLTTNLIKTKMEELLQVFYIIKNQGVWAQSPFQGIQRLFILPFVFQLRGTWIQVVSQLDHPTYRAFQASCETPESMSQYECTNTSGVMKQLLAAQNIQVNDWTESSKCFHHLSVGVSLTPWKLPQPWSSRYCLSFCAQCAVTYTNVQAIPGTRRGLSFTAI